MKTSELKDKSIAELNDELVSLKKEQFSLRMQQGVGQLAQTHQIKAVRRNIARVQTVINQKQSAGE